MAHQGTATARAAQNASTVAGLARFFPEASPVRMPVQLARVLQGSRARRRPISPKVSSLNLALPAKSSSNATRHWSLAIELHLRNSDGSFDVAVSVVAVQYQPGKTVVAARFRGEVPNWIVKS